MECAYAILESFQLNNFLIAVKLSISIIGLHDITLPVCISGLLLINQTDPSFNMTDIDLISRTVIDRLFILMILHPVRLSSTFLIDLMKVMRTYTLEKRNKNKLLLFYDSHFFLIFLMHSSIY